MLKVKAGDLDRMGLLFERYHLRLFGFLYYLGHNHDASEDMVEQAFYKMLKYRSRFADTGKFTHWIHTITRNGVKDRGKGKELLMTSEPLESMADWMPGSTCINEQLDKKEAAREFSQVILTNFGIKSIETMVQQWIFIIACVFFLTVEGRAQVKTLSGKNISREDLDLFVKKQMDTLSIPGMSIAIINNGRIVYHRSLGITSVDTNQPVNDKSIFEAASLSKPLFAYLVMKMVDKGLLDLDTPLYRYMPYPDIEMDDRYKLITARIVLTHQSGFPNWRFFNKADSSQHVKDNALYIKFRPGSQFSYSGEGFVYLAKTVAFLNHKTLQTLDLLFQREVAAPLKMQQAWYTGNVYISGHKVSGHEDGKPFGHAEGQLWGGDQRTNGYSWPNTFPGWDSSWFNPAAGLHTEAVSYARFLIGLMKGKGLIGTGLAEMLRPQVLVPKDNFFSSAYQDTAWGLGIGIAETPYGTRYDHAGSNGNFESHAVFYKERKYGYVFFLNCDKGDAFFNRLNLFLVSGK